jgi:hypothetical protein
MSEMDSRVRNNSANLFMAIQCVLIILWVISLGCLWLQFSCDSVGKVSKPESVVSKCFDMSGAGRSLLGENGALLHETRERTF